MNHIHSFFSNSTLTFFPFCGKKKESGTILILVAVFALVMMIFALSVISISTSQAISNQHQIERIKARQLAEGIWWLEYSNQLAGTTPTINPEVLDRKTFNVSISPPSSGTGPNGTDAFTIQIQY